MMEHTSRGDWGQYWDWVPGCQGLGLSRLLCDRGLQGQGLGRGGHQQDQD